jgi:hypothetical protein
VSKKFRKPYRNIKPSEKSKKKRNTREGMLNGFFTPLCPTSLLRNSCPMVCTSVLNYFLIHCRSLPLYFPPAFLVCRWYPEFFSSPYSGCTDSLFTEKICSSSDQTIRILQIYYLLQYDYYNYQTVIQTSFGIITSQDEK